MDALEVIVKQIDDKVSQLKEHLTSGRLSNFEEYKSLCGEIRGLLIARGYTLDLQKQMENIDDN